MSFPLSDEDLAMLKELGLLGPILVRKPQPWEVPMRVLSDVCLGIHPIFLTNYQRTVITENGIQKLGNAILDKYGYGLSLNELNDITTKTNCLGTIDMKDIQLNTKTFGGIR